MRHPESELQKACVKWFRFQYPEPKYLIFAIPNGGKRNAREAGRLKSEGVRAGVPDLAIIGNHNIFFIELKANGNRLTSNQKDVRRILGGNGFTTDVCTNFNEFKEIVDYELWTK